MNENSQIGYTPAANTRQDEFVNKVKLAFDNDDSSSEECCREPRREGSSVLTDPTEIQKEINERKQKVEEASKKILSAMNNMSLYAEEEKIQRERQAALLRRKIEEDRWQAIKTLAIIGGLLLVVGAGGGYWLATSSKSSDKGNCEGCAAPEPGDV